MSPTFPKLLVDFGRQFFWSPLTVSISRDQKQKSVQNSHQINSTFYCNDCNGETSIGGNSGSELCLSSHTLDEQPIGIITDLNDRNCLLNSSDCTHYCTNYDNCFDNTRQPTDIKFIISSNLKLLCKSLSEPNLLINSSSYSDLVRDQTIITDKNSGSDAHNRHNAVLESVTSIKSKTSDISNTPLDEIESIRSTTNPSNRLLQEEIDLFNTYDSCAASDSLGCELSNSAIEDDLFSQINNKFITTELCHNYLSDETNDDNSISGVKDKDSFVSTHESCGHKVNTKPTKMNRNYVNCNEVIGSDVKRDNKMQQNLRRSQTIQTISDYDSTENVVLNDYFDNSSVNRCEAAGVGAKGSPKRHSLSSEAALDEKKSSICSQRNSRRLIVTDKRLRNAVLDRLKRLGRSQSHGRSDTSITTNSSSRQFVLRTKGLYKNVKRRFSSVPPSATTPVNEEPTHQTEPSISIDDSNTTTYSKINVNTMDRLLDAIDSTGTDTTTPAPVVLRHCASYESIEDSGCGSSIQTSSLSTDSNRSSICTGDDMNSFYSSALLRGPFIGYAKAITDCTPCPYYKDALAFKRGDIISIVSKDESGTWIGLANGRIGHFKFVNVEEIKHSDKRKTALKLNQLIPVTIEREVESETNEFCESGIETQIFDRLKCRLVETNGALTLTDVKHIIGLSDLQLNLLSIYGYTDVKLFAQIANQDILNDCGITDAGAQHQVLNTTRQLRDYFGLTNSNQPLNRPQISSQKSWAKRRDMRCVSAPTTPAMTPNIDFTSDHFSQLISKLESVSTTSLEKSCSCDQLEQQFSHLNTIEKPIEEKHKNSINANTNSNCNDFNERIYENNEQIIIETHEQHNSTTFDSSAQQKPRLSSLERTDGTGIKPTKSRHNSVRFAIRDKSLDRNLLRKLDLKPIYMNDKNSCEPTARAGGISSSQSVMDLRINSINSSINDSSNSNQPIDTLRGKKRLKKLISSSRKFSSFSSHSSLQSLSNNTTQSDDSSRTKLVSNTLIEAIDIKLKSENIDLTEEPYSDSPAGFCGIPPALIQRYGDECQRDTYEVAEALDNLRMRALALMGRRGVPNDYLGDSCTGPVIDMASYENLHLWLISLGLPMYENCLKANGFDNLYRVSKLREVDLVNKCGLRERRHVRILTNAIGALHLSYGDIDKT